MKYDPKQAISCLQKGEYAATIEKAEESTSKAGAQMLVFQFRVYSGNRELVIKEYIVEATLFKLKQIAKAINQLPAFESGEFNEADYVGRNLTVELDIEEDDFGEKNRIKKYKCLAHPIPAGGLREAMAAVSDGDVPF